MKKALPSTIMEESEDDAPKRTQTKASRAVADEEESSKAPAAEKKKKRKLGALLGATTFTWDQTLVSRCVPLHSPPLIISRPVEPRRTYPGDLVPPEIVSGEYPSCGLCCRVAQVFVSCVVWDCDLGP